MYVCLGRPVGTLRTLAKGICDERDSEKRLLALRLRRPCSRAQPDSKQETKAQVRKAQRLDLRSSDHSSRGPSLAAPIVRMSEPFAIAPRSAIDKQRRGHVVDREEEEGKRSGLVLYLEGRRERTVLPATQISASHAQRQLPPQQEGGESETNPGRRSQRAPWRGPRGRSRDR